MLKRIASILFFLLIASSVSAQIYTMSTTTVTTCSGTFYDSGGAAGNYNNSEDITMTITSGNGNRISVTFTQFALASNDLLRIFDGATSSHPRIGIYNSISPGTIVSTGTSLTFRFTSNSSTSWLGWTATISCGGPALPSYTLSNGTITGCAGVFYDDSGPTGVYGVNVNLVQTFCSGTTDRLKFTFNNDPLATDFMPFDTLFVYDGATTSAPMLAAFTENSFLEDIISSGTCITFRFKTDATSSSIGWAAEFQCVTTPPPSQPVFNMSGGVRNVCNALFYDSGGSTGNYSINSSLTQAFTSYNGARITAAFTQFVVSINAILNIYDGPNNTYPLIGSYNTNSPGSITSTGNSLTFEFFSNSSITISGWEALITCGGPVIPVYNMSGGTVTACTGMFYDSGGGGGNYLNSQNLTQTFCSGSTDLLQFTFNNNSQANAYSTGDTLFVYDGPTTSSPILAAFTAGSFMENITSSNSCLTFRFVSNASGNSRGWAGQFQCVTTPAPSPQIINMSTGIRYTCNALFYDDGGSTQYYGDNLNNVQTITSPNNQRLSAAFTQFSLANDDWLIIYDGPTTQHPRIGIYWGLSNPGTIISTGSSLTFQFVSNSFSSSTGWEANITCAGPVLQIYNMSNGTVTACSGAFYDNGGPAANYTDNLNLTQTFCSGTTDRIRFTFLNDPQAVTYSSGDTLFVYDGSTVSAPMLAAYTTGSFMEDITSSGTCLTFRFSSNTLGNNRGWAGQFQCVTTPAPLPQVFNMSTGIRNVCNALFYDNGGSTANALSSSNLVQTFTSYNGERLSAVFTQFLLLNTSAELRIYDGPTTAHPRIGTYISNSPGTIISSGSSLTFEYLSNSNIAGWGWAANITCAGPVLPVYTTSSGIVTTCGGVFYDNGGATGSYPNNDNSATTFTSASGQYLKFDFNPNHFNIAPGDSLFVYDGPSTLSPLFAILTGNISPGSITSNTSSLTFRFVSNATSVNIGWQAILSCVSQPDTNPQITMYSGIRYTCGGTFYDTGGPNANYNDNENRIMSFYSNSGCGIRFTFNSVSLSTSDALTVFDGPNTSAPVLATITWNNIPGPLQSTGNVLTFRLISNSSNNSSGWSANISCPNQPLATISANGPLSFCPGGNVTLTAAPNSTYLWSNGATTQSITASTTGSYWVTVTNVNNCTATSNIINVNANASITGSVVANGPLTFCQGSSVTLTAGGGSSYVWSNSATGSMLNVTQSGNYYAVVSSGTCVDTTSVIAVTVNPLPVVTLTLMQDSFCTNQPSPSTLSGGSPAGGVWSGPGVSGNLFTPSVAGPGFHSVVYTYTDTNSCSNSASEVVYVDICNDVTEIQNNIFSAYPNPATQLVTINLGSENQVTMIELYDMTGRLIQSEAVNNRGQIQLSLNGLESGIYVVRAGSKQVKLIKE
ncbi:MAG: T9SS type A sorting domain-containing protein [Bacteroidia bacterium]|jgi:hypothetical protein|nr:T9SS type A sorting domain-containing protein [Bacteroidia bacterium]